MLNTFFERQLQRTFAIWRCLITAFVVATHHIFLIESQNISSCKGPVRITEANSLLLGGLPKIKSYDWQCCQDTPWTLAGLARSTCTSAEIHEHVCLLCNKNGEDTYLSSIDNWTTESGNEFFLLWRVGCWLVLLSGNFRSLFASKSLGHALLSWHLGGHGTPSRLHMSWQFSSSNLLQRNDDKKWTGLTISGILAVFEAGSNRHQWSKE